MGFCKPADRRRRERSARASLSAGAARATIIRRASAASDVCLSSRTLGVPELDFQSPSSLAAARPPSDWDAVLASR
jgi:hypothetical protein